MITIIPLSKYEFYLQAGIGDDDLRIRALEASLVESTEPSSHDAESGGAETSGADLCLPHQVKTSHASSCPQGKWQTVRTT